MTPKEQWEATQKANGLGITWEEHLAQREQDFAMAILNGLSGSNACKGADERRRMIPLHIADQAVAACEAEITKLREENARLKAENARLKTEVEHLMVFCNCTLIPNKELQARVERLTKAGDYMSSILQDNYNDVPDDPLIIRDGIRRWNAAKEGKPHA